MHFIRMTGAELHRLHRFTKKKTVDTAEMRTAMRLMARHSDLRHYLVRAGERAVRAYEQDAAEREGAHEE